MLIDAKQCGFRVLLAGTFERQSFSYRRTDVCASAWRLRMCTRLKPSLCQQKRLSSCCWAGSRDGSAYVKVRCCPNSVHNNGEFPQDLPAPQIALRLRPLPHRRLDFYSTHTTHNIHRSSYIWFFYHRASLCHWSPRSSVRRLLAFEGESPVHWITPLSGMRILRTTAAVLTWGYRCRHKTSPYRSAQLSLAFYV